MQLPREFSERMYKLLGEEYPAFEESLGKQCRRGLRVNPLKIKTEEFERIAPFHLTPVPWTKNGYYYEEEDAVSRHPFYYAGLYYLQEPSAMAPAAVLDVRPGMRVLDLCAAPGGKATALGEKLRGEGLLVANDISASRCRALLRNIELAGITNAFVTNAQPAVLAERFEGYFDRILLDAPCSGEGMFRKDEKVIRAWDPEKNDRCAGIQRELILEAAKMLRPGGRLIYSTCTFSRLENEDVIGYLLTQDPAFRLLPIPSCEGFSPGFDSERLCVRIWPHKAEGEGHFMALLEKTNPEITVWAAGTEAEPGDRAGRENQGQSCQDQHGRSQKDRDQINPEKKSHKGKKQNRKKTAERHTPGMPGGPGRTEELKLFRDFFERQDIPDPMRVRKPDWMKTGSECEIRGSQVYKSAIDPETVRGIPFLRNGIYLGELKKNRFEPSQSLALAWYSIYEENDCPGEMISSGKEVPSGEMKLVFPPEDGRLPAYLRGETLELSEAEGSGAGWKLVSAGEYPLGWGKVTGNTLKNKYPPAWYVHSGT